MTDLTEKVPEKTGMLMAMAYAFWALVMRRFKEPA